MSAQVGRMLSAISFLHSIQSRQIGHRMRIVSSKAKRALIFDHNKEEEEAKEGENFARVDDRRLQRDNRLEASVGEHENIDKEMQRKLQISTTATATSTCEQWSGQHER